MEKNLHPVISVRIFREEKCFGPGVAVLLKNVQEHRSLRSAAASMGMAYSKSWTILKTSENELGFKLLHSTTGGRHGGGAALTDVAYALQSVGDAAAGVPERSPEDFSENGLCQGRKESDTEL